MIGFSLLSLIAEMDILKAMYFLGSGEEHSFRPAVLAKILAAVLNPIHTSFTWIYVTEDPRNKASANKVNPPITA